MIRFARIGLMILISTSVSQAYVASGYSPRENLCLNGSWDILVWAQTKPDKEYDLTLVYPPTSSGGWYPCLLPENLWHWPGECTEKGGHPAWRSVGWPSHAAWFMKRIEVPNAWKGKRVLFRSGGVSYDATLYINGHYAGRHRNHLPFVFDITPLVRYGTTNQIDLGYLAPSVTHDEKANCQLEPGGDWTDKLVGPYGDLCLEPVGDAYVDDINVLCHWADKTLTVPIDVINPGGRNDITVEANIYDGRTRVKSAAAKKEGNQFVLRLAWPDVIAWQPGQPHLYDLELVVRTGGTVTDRYHRRFGFREFTTRDGKYLLNGKQIRLNCNATSVTFSGQMFDPDYIRGFYRAMRDLNINTLRLHGTPMPTVWLDVADEEGMLIIDEGLFAAGSWSKINEQRPPYDFVRRWPRFQQFFREWVIRDRNHPCVIQWSAANEPDGNIRAAEIFDVIRRTDGSGRPVFNDGAYSLHADVISKHYPVCPILGWVGPSFPYWPDDLYFLDEPTAVTRLTERWKKWYLPNLNEDFARSFKYQIEFCRTLAGKPWGERWVCDGRPPRPLSIGESFLPEAWTLDEFSRFFGDRAYRGVYDLENGPLWQALGEWTADAVEAYRYMGVDHFNLPWHPTSWCLSSLYRADGESIVKECGKPLENTPGYHPYRIVADRPVVNPGWNKSVPERIVTATGRELRRAYQPIRLIVRPEQKAFFPGQTLVRQFAVVNDTLEDRKFSLKVRLGEATIFDKPYAVPAGGVVRDRLAFDLAKASPGRLTLSAVLTDGQGKIADEVSEKIAVFPPLQKCTGREMVVFDRSGKTLALFKRLGLSASGTRDLTTLKRANTGTILVIGENALKEDSKIASVIARWTDEGGQVLILAQEQFGDLDIGGRVRIFNVPNSQAFIRNPDHPLIAGLAPDDLELWGESHMVTRCSPQFERLGNAAIVVDQGSSKGLVHPVVAEFFRGQGRIVLLQCLCVDQFDAGPIPGRVLANTLAYLDRPVPRFGALVVRDKEAQAGWASVGVRSGPEGKVLFLTGKDRVTDADVNTYNVLWFNRPSAEQLQFLGRYFGRLVVKPAQVMHCQLELGQADALLAGVTSRDLYPIAAQPPAPTVFEIQKSNAAAKPLLVEPDFTPQTREFGGIGPRTTNIQIPTSTRRRIKDPGAAMLVLRTKDKTFIVETLDWDTFRHQESIQNLAAKIMTNLHIAVNSNPGTKDTDTLGIINQEAVYRVDCGQQTGRRTIWRIPITQRECFGMANEKEVLVAYKDHAGNEWLADQPWKEGGDFGYLGGGTVDRGSDLQVAGTLDDGLFQTERYHTAGYKFKLTNGKYRVRLFFAETFDGIGASGNRVFSITANDQPVATDLDIFKRVGMHRALVIEKIVSVTHGIMDIAFIPKAQDPCINAIEILPKD